jgi:C4-dicarboxylate-binding protein DctP
VVDGTENPVSNFYTQKMHEVQKHMTMSNHGYLGYAVITNKAFWDGLPVDIRTALTQAMKEATVFEREIAQKDNDEALARVIAAKTTTVYQLTPSERAEWQKALLPIHQQFESTIGAELIQSVYATAAQVAREHAAQPAPRTTAKK